jgi:uncharacterized membrane protein
MTISTPNDDVGPIGAEVDEFLAPAETPAPPPPPSHTDGRDERADDDARAPVVQSTFLAVADREVADVAAAALARVARAFPAALTSALQGEWLGHPLHPALTDFPLGCWMSASLLDLAGGRRARPAATRLVALGLLGVPVVAAAGLVDWDPIDPERERRARRVGATHAVANVVAAACYFVSWRARRSAHHGVGVVTALAGAAVTLFSGYLGGELVFGVSERDD